MCDSVMFEGIKCGCVEYNGFNIERREGDL